MEIKLKDFVHILLSFNREIKVKPTKILILKQVNNTYNKGLTLENNTINVFRWMVSFV